MCVHLVVLACALHIATGFRVTVPKTVQSLRSVNESEQELLTAAAGTCPGTGVACSGNECCPGYDGTFGLTIPCPDADAGWNECQAQIVLNTPDASTTAQPSATCPGTGVTCTGNQCCPGYDGTFGMTTPCPDADDDWNECDAKIVLNEPSSDDPATCPGTYVACSGNTCCPGYAASNDLSFPCPLADEGWNECENQSPSTTEATVETTTTCPGSNIVCNGNQCCPGYDDSNGLTFPCPGADEGWNLCQTNHEVPVVSAIGDPHVTGLSGESFDLWQTGWSKFVQIPPGVEDWNTKFVVAGNVIPYNSGEDKCAAPFLQDVQLSGSWLEQSLVLVRAGSLESSAPFAVSVNGSAFKQIDTSNGTEFVARPAFTMWGEIRADEPEKWGPDAKFMLTLGTLTVEVTQHTEGRWEESKSMLDLSVTGLDHVEESVGGWLGVDGPSQAGDPPQGCATMNLRHVPSQPHGLSHVTGFRSSHG